MFSVTKIATFRPTLKYYFCLVCFQVPVNTRTQWCP